jgi:hypothetical protein
MKRGMYEPGYQSTCFYFFSQSSEEPCCDLFVFSL